MKKQLLKGLAVGVVVAFMATHSAQADTIFVGSWSPDNGAYWGNNPLTYSGVGAADLLFSSVAQQTLYGAGSFQISTVDANPANIDHQAWYNVYADGSRKLAENYFFGTEGVTHYQDSPFETASAYVSDFHTAGRNYAFWVTPNASTNVPDGGSTGLLLGLAAMPLLLMGSRRFAYARI